MKTLFKSIAILTVLLTVITSCDDVKDLADIKVGTTITETFEVDLDGGADASVTQSIPITVITPVVAPYKDKLKKVKINKITLQVIQFNGDDNAEFTVDFMADNTSFLNETFVVSSAFSNQTMFEVSDSAGINDLALKLLNSETVVVNISAASENLDSEVYFKVEVKFDVDVTANPL